MKLIKPSVEYIPQEDIYKHIELCARTCYKSEDKITEDSARKFVDGLIKAGHLAMLEHGTIYLAMPMETMIPFELNDWGRYYQNRYSDSGTVCEIDDKKMIAVTTNLRVLVENDWLDDLQYACEPTEHHKRRYTMKFICDRGVSHELVRHRVFSFAQESQRYCNYSKYKFGNEVTFVNNPDGQQFTETYWLMDAYSHAEKVYLRLLKEGYSPQQARSVLPNATKTEIVMTGFEEDWRHFFSLRLRGTTGKPHPDMQYIAQLAWNEFKDKLNLEL